MLLDEDLGPLNDRQRDALALVQQGALRLLSLTNDLLDVTRIEAERVDLVMEPADLAEIVATTVAAHRAQLTSRQQDLVFRASSDLPPALCDRARVRQIVDNLLSNAIKYTPASGQITVEVTRAATDGFLRVSIADTGVGIAPEDQDQIFGRFFRAGSATQADANGAGLGLHIAYALAELHGGRIWFESTLGKGSVFHVTFAIAEPEAPSFP
jgi:signal transduction histidine kinase